MGPRPKDPAIDRREALRSLVRFSGFLTAAFGLGGCNPASDGVTLSGEGGYYDYANYADYFDYADYLNYANYADGGYGDYWDYGDYANYGDYFDYADYAN
ncbi:MAG: hypothetical protein JXP34_03390, partial [Planctomycetes bacterium]|nr:hypothetical protein [Planctomycetota bacterium]